MPDASSTETAPGARVERVLVCCSDPALVEAIERSLSAAALPACCEVRRASDPDGARESNRQAPPDLVLIDAAAARDLLTELTADEYAPPVLVLAGGLSADEQRRLWEAGAFAVVSTAGDLAQFVRPALTYRRLERENKLIREESDLIHTELLTSYGAVSEQSHVLEAEVRRRTQALQESEQKYRALINDANEAIFLVERDSFRILEVNRKAAELTGVPEQDLVNQSLTDLIAPQEAAGLEQAFRHMAESGNLLHPNLTLRRPQAGSLTVDLSASLIRYGGPEVMQCICHDVTDRKRLEAHLLNYTEELERQVAERTRELQRSHAQLLQQEKMAALGQLVAGIAHEMHTPIGTITSNADILTRSLARLRQFFSGEGCPESVRNNPELTRVVGIVEEISRVNQLASDRIIAIVRSLRNFARLDEAEVKSADLHEGIESTLTLVHHQLRNRIKVERQFGQIPRIPCHANQLNQVFMNMLVNASHAIQGTGTITIRTFREDDMVKIQISDTGSGIRPENLHRIFDPGFTTKGVGVGTGLGLSICYKIIQEHGGRIDVQSEVGRGTTFTISLPVQ